MTDHDAMDYLSKLEPNERVNPYNKLQAVEALPEATEDTLDQAVYTGRGLFPLMADRIPTLNDILENHEEYLLKALGFQALGDGKYKHLLFDEIITFDEKDTYMHLAFQIYKAGYKNAKNELSKTL